MEKLLNQTVVWIVLLSLKNIINIVLRKKVIESQDSFRLYLNGD